MPVVDLSAYKPVPATLGDANQIASGFQAIQAVLNGIDNLNFAAGKIFDPTKLMQNGAVQGQALLWDAASSTWKPGSASGVLYRKTTAKTVNTTVAATDLLNGEITLAAGDLGTTKALRATLEGDWLNNAGAPFAPPRIQVVVGGTIVLDTGAAAANNTINQGVARGGWTVEIFALELGATNSQLWRIKQTIALPQGVLTSDNGPFTTGEGSRLYSTAAGGNAIGFAQGFNTSALDMTTAKTFVINVINGSASASYETKLFGALVEIT